MIRLTLTKKRRLWHNGRVEVNSFATFRLITEVKTLQIDLPNGAGVMDAVREIVRLHPVLRSHWLDQDGSLHAHVHIFVNGEEAATLPQGFETALQPSTVVDFVPPVAGG